MATKETLMTVFKAEKLFKTVLTVVLNTITIIFKLTVYKYP